MADFITNFVQAAIWRVIDELYEYDPKANTFVPRNTRGITHQYAQNLVTIHSDPRFTATWTNPAND